jgi:hypothetical protein
MLIVPAHTQRIFVSPHLHDLYQEICDTTPGTQLPPRALDPCSERNDGGFLPIVDSLLMDVPIS